MPHLLCVPYLPRPLRLLRRLTMPGYDDPNRPEWTGKRKAKNFARINAACKGLKNLRWQAADGMPQVRHKPQVRGVPRVRVPAIETVVSQSGASQENLPCLSKTPMSGYFSPRACARKRMSPPCSA